MNWKPAINSFTAYLKLERGLSANTLSSYRSDLKKVALWAEEQSIQPLALQPELIREYLGVLLQEGLNARSQARFISALRSFYKFLLLEELLTVDPTELIDSPQIGRALPDVLTEDDINAIIKAIDLSKPQGERNRAMLEMLYGCGLRVSELVNVQLSNLRFIDGYIIVTGKGNKQRIVPINRAAIKYVTLYREQVRVHQAPVRGSEDVLFLNRRGKKLTRVMVFTIIKNLAVKAGITKHVSPHTFRHSFATHMVNRGANLRVVQEMLGHESITTTEIYTHLNETKLRDTITKFHPRA
jgi:integrase/recombinase XerD